MKGILTGYSELGVDQATKKVHHQPTIDWVSKPNKLCRPKKKKPLQRWSFLPQNTLSDVWFKVIHHDNSFHKQKSSEKAPFQAGWEWRKGQECYLSNVFFLGMFIINVLLNSYGTHGIFQKKLESRLVKSWEEFWNDGFVVLSRLKYILIQPDLMSLFICMFVKSGFASDVRAKSCPVPCERRQPKRFLYTDHFCCSSFQYILGPYHNIITITTSLYMVLVVWYRVILQRQASIMTIHTLLHGRRKNADFHELHCMGTDNRHASRFEGQGLVKGWTVEGWEDKNGWDKMKFTFIKSLCIQRKIIEQNPITFPTSMTTGSQCYHSRSGTPGHESFQARCVSLRFRTRFGKWQWAQVWWVTSNCHPFYGCKTWTIPTDQALWLSLHSDWFFVNLFGEKPAGMAEKKRFCRVAYGFYSQIKGLI